MSEGSGVRGEEERESFPVAADEDEDMMIRKETLCFEAELRGRGLSVFVCGVQRVLVCLRDSLQVPVSTLSVEVALRVLASRFRSWNFWGTCKKPCDSF